MPTIVVLDRNAASAAGLEALIASEGYQPVLNPDLYELEALLRQTGGNPMLNGLFVDGVALKSASVRELISLASNPYHKVSVLITRPLEPLFRIPAGVSVLDKPVKPASVLRWVRSIPRR